MVLGAMNREDFFLFNQYLDEKTKDLTGVNFIRFIGADDGKKCSVVLKYKQEKADMEYYGLHPRFAPDVLLPLLQQGRFRNQKGLLEVMNEYHDLFHLHSGQSSCREAVFAKVLLRMASRFGIVVEGSIEDADSLIQWMKRNQDLFIEGVTFKIEPHERPKVVEIYFLGGLIDEAAQWLDQSGYGVKADQDHKTLKLLSRPAEGVTSFNNIYDLIDRWRPTEAFRLSHGAVYYSGVLPRVVHVEKKDSFSNPDVQTIKLEVERTTFATVDAFDYSDINHHPLLKPYYGILTDFDRQEDEAQHHLFSQEAYQSNDKMLESVNKYLRESNNTHTVAVSGNLITKSNTVLVANRHHKVIDSGTYYCSVNGQSEFRDKNVSFYQESVNEDYPTLVADPDYRNGFSDELNRETLAELNISSLKRDWEYYGIAILGIHNKNDKPVYTRRMHFNILANNLVEEDLNNIILLRSNATEKYENQMISGIKLDIYYGFFDKLKTLGARMVEILNKHGQTIVYFLGFLVLLFTGLKINIKQGDAFELVNAWSTYSLAFIALIHTILRLSKWLKEYFRLRTALMRHSYTAKGNLISNVKRLSEQILSTMNYHPILLLMLSLHLYDLFERNSRVKEK